MKRIYRSIIHELYPGEYEWWGLFRGQEERQRQRGRDLAKLRPWERGRTIPLAEIARFGIRGISAGNDSCGNVT